MIHAIIKHYHALLVRNCTAVVLCLMVDTRPEDRSNRAQFFVVLRRPVRGDL